MKLLRDPLGRPIKRLYFKTEELDERCEQIVADFMRRHSGGYRLPIPTDDIIRMIEAEADDLDMYANLPEGQDGYTDFFFDRKPRVKISARLSDPRYENRLRFTLGHEYGHVWFHAPLWRKSAQEPDSRPAEPSWTCHRENIETAAENDWMEFQAGYIGGALLMPKSELSIMARVRLRCVRARSRRLESIRSSAARRSSGSCNVARSPNKPRESGSFVWAF